MYEGEHDKADAFYLDYNVLVFLDTLYVAFIAFVEATGDSDMLVLSEILFIENLATSCIVGCKQA